MKIPPLLRDITIVMLFLIGTMCVVLVVIGVTHDLSDGKADGTKYVNGCDR